MTTSFNTSAKVFQYIRKIQPDIIHLEALQIRSVGLLPSILLVKKLLVAVHDPLPHSGETSWKINLTRFSFFRYPISKGYLLYSRFARQQFDTYYPQLKSSRYELRLNSYSYYRNYLNGQDKERKHILFFGRLSPYKGIDVLLKAFPDVLNQFPNENLVIAGKSFDGYEPDAEVIQKNKENITVLNRYITNKELVTLVSQAKFIVCPYKDATQSGVLMTAYALDTPVIATDVGAFPEYIQDNVTGMLVPVNDPVRLAEKMVAALENDFYKEMEMNLSRKDKTNSWASENREVFMNAYAL
jgi:glycosyltransferase involved in cell wall biosynthesis